MNPAGIISQVILLLLAVAVAVAVRRYGLQRRSVAWMRARCGSSVSLMSMCVVIADGRKLRGIMGLAGDEIAWRSLRFSRARMGSIPLSAIDFVMWGDSRPCWLSRLAGGTGFRVLTVRERDGAEISFLLDGGQAILWDKVLEVRLGEPASGLPGDDQENLA